jgi:acetyltransferase-like isoleucine patch superfamily enzyme
MSQEQESRKEYGLRRIINKILQSIARNTLVPIKMRVYLQAMRGVNFKNKKNTQIGDNVGFDGIYPQNIYIGERCGIAAGTRILTHYIDTRKLSDHPDHHFRYYQGNVVIEDDVFIGTNCVISKPVTIGKGAIIGANVVITKDVPPGAVMVGTSARNIKDKLVG